MNISINQPSSTRSRGCRGQRGQSLPLVLCLVWLAAGAAWLLVQVGQRAADEARAQTAADAAALAGVVDPDLAEPLAQANGRRLAGRRTDASSGRRLEVLVDGSDSAAWAAAEAEPGSWGGLHPELVTALRRAEQVVGQPVPVVSGYRTFAEQQALWDNAGNNPYPVARPGTSMHERGLAVDVPRDFVPVLRPIAASIGLCQPLPATDPVHFVLCVMPSP